MNKWKEILEKTMIMYSSIKCNDFELFSYLLKERDDLLADIGRENSDEYNEYIDKILQFNKKIEEEIHIYKAEINKEFEEFREYKNKTIKNAEKIFNFFPPIDPRGNVIDVTK